MTETFFTFIEKEREELNKRLPSLIESLNIPNTLKQSMSYSLKAGGKRLRPLLLLATLQGYNKPLDLGYDVAAAIEMIHTYSLIHDDLPAMDDDHLRRGKPTNHKVYGEAMAILAGDGLLTYSFQHLSSLNLDNDIKVNLILEISKAAGPEGMVGGQVADLEGENKELVVEELEGIHDKKTGELLAVSVVAGAIIAKVSDSERTSLRHFAKHLGIAFQIKDDILDVEGDQLTIGKPIGSDEQNNKSTYPKLLGMAGAKEKLSYHIEIAKRYLYNTNMDHTLLLDLTNYIESRSK